MSNRNKPAVRNMNFFGNVALLPCLDVDKLNPFPVSRTFISSPTWKFQGGVPEWLKGTGCKPVGVRLRWFESNSLHQSAQGAGFDRRLELDCDWLDFDWAVLFLRSDNGRDGRE